MSHFSVLVLADHELDREAAESYVTNVLEPYSEDHQVEEYERECYCVGVKAKMDARRKVDGDDLQDDDLQEVTEKLRQQFAVLRSVMESLPEGPERDAFTERKRQLGEEWTALADRRKAQIDALERAHPMYGKANPTCGNCAGSGRMRTTANPRGYWDWWEIGGRWSGVLDAEYDPELDPRNFEKCRFCGGTGKRKDISVSEGCNACQGTGMARKWLNAAHDGDVMPLSAVTVEHPEGIFFAAVTPDGEWHQQGNMGWFGMSSDEMDEETWRSHVRSLLEANREGTAIVVDCHV